MGTISQNISTLIETMKLFALIAAVSAEWNGVSTSNTCGMQIAGDNFVNKTCTVSGSSLSYVFAGNGAFITGANTFTGYDGVSGAVDVVVFFDQAEDANGGMDNSTCWDAEVNCVDDGAATAGVFFMESVNDHRGAKGGNYNLQISGVSSGDTITIQLTGADGNGWGAQNISAPFGTVAATADAWGNQFSDSGAFSVSVDQHDPFGDLFQISVTQQPGNTAALDLWASSVSN